MKKFTVVVCRSKKIFSAIIILQFFFCACTVAQGNLVLMPKRVVFEGAKRYEEINLANIGKDTSRYVISLMHVRMNEDGSFTEIREPGEGENFADKYIRFFPHSVTLGPNESQVVKIQLNRSGDLTTGEYRSHIYFRAVPNTLPLGDTTTKKEAGITIKLTPIFGITIPVIIRVGETSSQVTLADLSVQMTEDTIPVLNMTFQRTGNASVYGDLTVDYVPDHGKTISVGLIRGIAVYTPNALRRIKLKLQNHPGIDYHSGKLHISYKITEDAKKSTLAETELVLH